MSPLLATVVLDARLMPHLSYPRSFLIVVFASLKPYVNRDKALEAASLLLQSRTHAYIADKHRTPT